MYEYEIILTDGRTEMLTADREYFMDVPGNAPESIWRFVKRHDNEDHPEEIVAQFRNKWVVGYIRRLVEDDGCECTGSCDVIKAGDGRSINVTIMGH